MDERLTDADRRDRAIQMTGGGRMRCVAATNRAGSSATGRAAAQTTVTGVTLWLATVAMPGEWPNAQAEQSCFS